MVVGSVLDVRRGRRYENFFGIPVPIIPCHHHLDRKLDSVSKHYLEFISTLDNLRVHFSVTLICGVFIYLDTTRHEN